MAILWLYKSQRRSHNGGRGLKETHGEKDIDKEKKEKKREKEQTESIETKAPKRTHGEK